jgi:Fe2+ transport system protein FeoA
MIKKIRKTLQTSRANKQLRHDHHQDHALNCAALCCARSGQSACVISFSGDEGEAARLRDLGVREGAIVTVLRDSDPLLIRVDDARFGIGRAAAMNVLCELK